MTDSEREFARAVLARQRLGWAHLEAERLANLVGLVTRDVLPSFQDSFEYARKLPPRTESGFVTFYEVLARGGRP